MVIPVNATLPDSTLAPADIAAKFQSTSMAGLGLLQCDESGCFDDGSGPGVTMPPTESIDLCALYPLGCSASSGGINVQPGVYSYPGANPSANNVNYNQLLQTLIKSGVDVAKLSLVQPGTTLNANGSINRQNPGFAIPSGGTISANAGFSSSALLLGLGVLALFMFNKK